MTAKEKAEELGNKFYQGSIFDYDEEGHKVERERAKERAIKCVDEILNVIETILSLLATEPSLKIIRYKSDYKILLDEDYTEVSSEYWQEVKREIKKL
tara:strand:- start:359 stop:652 length:294 start_codon:yes stop_codon:yes gene_type:complete